ncbi:MAG: hypothetical protein A2096_14085 [Spirochaetes bacterium GWF1_41_5]|nr:MAG: hypothetical protein A2096_14085 [Spirochaetes bacterium GWF1_41_5]HBE00928.1 hypothetical protein [Spirochaetia bacterium]
MNKKLLFLHILYFTHVFPVWFNDTPPELAVYFRPLARVYQRNEPLMVRVIIKNIRNNTVAMSLSENLFEHLDLILKNDRNEVIEPSDQYLVWKHGGVKAAASRKQICLGFEDEFSTIINLSEWFQIPESGRYFISGVFNLNPSFAAPGELAYTASESGFNINRDFYEQIEEDKKTEQQKAVDLKNIPPYTVAEMYINSENERNWDVYFSLINIEKFLLTSFGATSFYERFVNSITEERGTIIAEFKNHLIKNNDYKTLQHKIVKTVITGNLCDITLRSREQFFPFKYVKTFNPQTLQIEVDWKENRSTAYTRIKETYLTLELFDGVWQITKKQVHFVQSYD